MFCSLIFRILNLACGSIHIQTKTSITILQSGPLPQSITYMSSTLTSNSFIASYNMAPDSTEPILNTFSTTPVNDRFHTVFYTILAIFWQIFYKAFFNLKYFYANRAVIYPFVLRILQFYWAKLCISLWRSIQIFHLTANPILIGEYVPVRRPL